MPAQSSPQSTSASSAPDNGAAAFDVAADTHRYPITPAEQALIAAARTARGGPPAGDAPSLDNDALSRRLHQVLASQQQLGGLSAAQQARLRDAEQLVEQARQEAAAYQLAASATIVLDTAVQP